MNSAKIAYEQVDGIANVVRIPLAEIKDPDFVQEVLRDTFEACFKNGISRFVIDLNSVEHPKASLIALLIEATSRARRIGGDVKILHLSTTTRTVMSTFSPANYLSLEKDEADALQDFGSVQGEDVDIPKIDIAEDPIIEEIQSRFDNQQASAGPEEAVTTKTGPTEESQAKPKGERNHLRVKSEAKNLYVICDFVTNYAERAGLKSKDVGKIKIAVYEATLNVVEHAYHSNPEHWIDVWLEYNVAMFKVIIQDYGHCLDKFEDKKYDVVSAMDGRKTGGFGLYIIHRSMDEVEYRPDKKHGNRLTMIKFLNQTST